MRYILNKSALTPNPSPKRRGGLLIFALLFSFVFSACKKDENVISDTPEIKFESVSPGSVKEYSGAITFVISYIDGDGDLGENNSDVKNLYLTDARNNITYQYRIPMLAPSGSSIAIKGNLNVVLEKTGIVNSSASSESATFYIYLKDRAGNQSNTVTSSAVTITK